MAEPTSKKAKLSSGSGDDEVKLTSFPDIILNLTCGERVIKCHASRHMLVRTEYFKNEIGGETKEINVPIDDVDVSVYLLRILHLAPMRVKCSIHGMFRLMDKWGVAHDDACKLWQAHAPGVESINNMVNDPIFRKAHNAELLVKFTEFLQCAALGDIMKLTGDAQKIAICAALRAYRFSDSSKGYLNRAWEELTT